MGGSGSWKVAYADFVTAMMAFFLLMWILNAAPEATKQVLSEYFTEGGMPDDTTNPVNLRLSALVPGGAQLSVEEKTYVDIAQELKQFMLNDEAPTNANGLSSTNAGVLLRVTGDAMFESGSVIFTQQGMQTMDEVIAVMKKYSVYLNVRGHSSTGETGAPDYPSKWELSSARATAAVRYLIDKGGLNPSFVRAVAYADTHPLLPDTDQNAAAMNRRVEFLFFRPELAALVEGY